MQLNEQLKKFRIEHNLTQEELAQKIYVSRQTISKWENGKVLPDLENLVLLSELYGITLDVLIGGTVAEIQKPKFLIAQRYLLCLIILSLLLLILQITLKPQLAIIPLIYSLFCIILSWRYLSKTNRGSNIYAQAENMYDPGIIFFGISYALLFVAIALQMAIDK